MIKQAQERPVTVNERMRGGNGSVIIEHIADKDALYGKGRLYARIVLQPGCSIGYHTHENETEIFYILKGAAVYDDNGAKSVLSPGDVTHTPGGSGHSIANEGDENVELIALIVYQD